MNILALRRFKSIIFTAPLLAALGCDVGSKTESTSAAGAPNNAAGGGPGGGSGGNSSSNASALTYRGVNLSCAEWGKNLPGTYDVDYTYPTHTEVDYFTSKGMNTFRLPFAWERLQQSLSAELDAGEQSHVDDFVTYATSKGAYVILDPHNYARYRGVAIGQAGGPSNDDFADLWSRLATSYASNDHVIFGLMNEPHDIAVSVWLSAANAALQAIRAAGATNLVLVPGSNWTGASSWVTSNTAMLGVSDPLDNYVFEVHQYNDSDQSGTHAQCVSATIGSQRLQAFTDWLVTNGKKGFLGEFMGPNNPTCLSALEDMLSFVDAHSSVWSGWTYWSAGPWWGPQPATDGSIIEPSADGDAPQMPVLEPHL